MDSLHLNASAHLPHPYLGYKEGKCELLQLGKKKRTEYDQYALSIYILPKYKNNLHSLNNDNAVLRFK